MKYTEFGIGKTRAGKQLFSLEFFGFMIKLVKWDKWVVEDKKTKRK